MAIKHTLSLLIAEQYNPKILSITDTSVYAEGLGISCTRLEITRPGSNQPLYLEVQKDFRLNLTSHDLHYTKPGTDEGALPDGVYTIRYSAAPNDKVWVEYTHLRVVNILNQYHGILCTVDLSGCDPKEEVKEKLRELRMIRLYIETAVAKVENCHDTSEGVAILNYAKKLLDRFGKSCC
jgi:hypothetical protein